MFIGHRGEEKDYGLGKQFISLRGAIPWSSNNSLARFYRIGDWSFCMHTHRYRYIYPIS